MSSKDGKSKKKKGLKSPKRKGDAFERELATYFNDHLGLQSHRTPLSGGGLQFAANIAPSADLTGTPQLWVEAKRTQAINFRKALEQAEKGSDAHGNVDIPVVINRRDRESMDDSVVAMRLKDFMVFYRMLLGGRQSQGKLLYSDYDLAEQDEKDFFNAQENEKEQIF
jgi:hypothetical protein